MKIDRERVRSLLKGFKFNDLLNELGWDHFAGKLDIDIDADRYALTGIAQKREVFVFVCAPHAPGHVPDAATRRKIERKVAKTHFQHLIIYADAKKTEQRWQWVRRDPGRPDAPREEAFHVSQTGESLVQKLTVIAVSLDEEESFTHIDTTSRVRAGFDVEPVTKKFYEGFAAEHNALLKFIEGIPVEELHRQYVSVILNRLMFIYFIQKRGFLNGDPEYLRTKLAESERKAKDSFYADWLCPLFFEGFAKKKSERSEDVKKRLGDIPYLNGGLFQKHQIEQHHGNTIKVPDKAFRRIFQFFDAYKWHLDERPLRNDNEINPDVLGYIFEKYINDQADMGAYYTKEDVTGYITVNTILPFLLDKTAKTQPGAFAAGGFVWSLLVRDPSRYIYAAVKKGVLDDAGGVVPAPVKPLTGTNDSTYALSTESPWEYAARRQRCLELLDTLKSGKVGSVSDVITYNLDFARFAADLIFQTDDPGFLRDFHAALATMSVLDPTCGSGAFLFAALNVLEPLYTRCVERMRTFLNDAGLPAGHREHFKHLVAQPEGHISESYFVYKSIIINNLFGVDLMAEAVEICKLRLFLKLVAQIEDPNRIEPLPDIDFNIRSGNTLIGYANKGELENNFNFAGKLAAAEQKLALVDRTLAKFRAAQLDLNDRSTAVEARVLKQTYVDQLSALADDLDRLLAVQHARVGDVELVQFKSSHRPFHWYAEFHAIMAEGGFDAIIGNPPYVATRKVDYLSREHQAHRFSDIYGLVMLRVMGLLKPEGKVGLIVPLSITFSGDFGGLRAKLCAAGSNWFSSFDNIPAALFAGVSQRCTIWLGSRIGKAVFVAPMYRWRSAYREHLMQNLSFVLHQPDDCRDFGLPKLSNGLLSSALQKIRKPQGVTRRQLSAPKSERKALLGYSQTCRNFVSVFRENPPCLMADTLKPVPSAKIGYVALRRDDDVYAALATLAGEAYFWYWLTRGDGFDVTGWIVTDFLACLEHVEEPQYRLLIELGRLLHARRHEALQFKKNAGKYVGNFNYRGLRDITRRADLLLLGGLGMSQAEARAVFDYVHRVLAINEYAGEKSIPPEVKARYRPDPFDDEVQDAIFAEVDALVMEKLAITVDEPLAGASDDASSLKSQRLVSRPSV